MCSGIDSPEGAYPADPSLTGPANFGFYSKYQPGSIVPTGKTKFEFADLDFLSQTHHWLVVGDSWAMFMGSGTINGSGNYGFTITVIDEKCDPDIEVDELHIRIWDKDDSNAIVYDSQADGGTTPLAGGKIVIHK